MNEFIRMSRSADGISDHSTVTKSGDHVQSLFKQLNEVEQEREHATYEYNNACDRAKALVLKKWKQNRTTSSRHIDPLIIALENAAIYGVDASISFTHDDVLIAMCVDDFLEEVQYERMQLDTKCKELADIERRLMEFQEGQISSKKETYEDRSFTEDVDNLTTNCYDNNQQTVLQLLKLTLSKLTYIETRLTTMETSVANLETLLKDKVNISIAKNADEGLDSYVISTSFVDMATPVDISLETSIDIAHTNTSPPSNSWVNTHTLSDHIGSVTALCQLRDGRLISGGGPSDQTMKVWDLISNKCIQTIKTQCNGMIYALLQLSDGRLLSGDCDKMIKVWDTNATIKTSSVTHPLSSQMTLIGCWYGHTQAIRGLIELMPDSSRHGFERVASCSGDGTIRIWESRDGTRLKTIHAHQGEVLSIIQLIDGRIASAGQNKTIKIWSIDDGICMKMMYHGESVSCLCQLSCNERLVSGSSVFGNTNAIKIWDLDNSEAPLMILLSNCKSIWSIVELKDGTLASATNDKTIKVWDTNKGECLYTLSGHNLGVRTLIELADGRLASGECTIFYSSHPEYACIKFWECRE